MLSEKTKKELYKLAFAFKRTKLWETLGELQIFAVPMPDGQTGYCSVFGQKEAGFSLSLYIGKRGFSNFYDIIQLDRGELPVDDAIQWVYVSNQDRLQCMFRKKEYASKETVQEAMDYAKILHRRLTRPFPVPQFERFAPGHRPTPITSEEDAACIMEALRATVFLADSIRRGSAPVLILPFQAPDSQVLLMTPDAAMPGKYTFSFTQLPGYQPPEIAKPTPIDEFTAARMRKFPISGSWQGGIAFLFPYAMPGREETYIPTVPIILDENGGTLPLLEFGEYDDHPTEMLRKTVEFILSQEKRPKQIQVRRGDLRGCAFFGCLAEAMQIPLIEEDELPDLNDAIMNLSMGDENTFKEDLDKICNALRTLDYEEMKEQMPGFFMLLEQLMTPEVQEMLPADVIEILKSYPEFNS